MGRKRVADMTPEEIERERAYNRERNRKRREDPEYRERERKRKRERHRKRREDPEYRERERKRKHARTVRAASVRAALAIVGESAPRDALERGLGLAPLCTECRRRLGDDERGPKCWRCVADDRREGPALVRVSVEAAPPSVEDAKRERKREHERKWRDAHPEYKREYMRKWRDAHPERDARDRYVRTKDADEDAQAALVVLRELDDETPAE